jgi:hypothetical protein
MSDPDPTDEREDEPPETPTGDDPDAPGLSVLDERPDGGVVEPNEPA